MISANSSGSWLDAQHGPLDPSCMDAAAATAARYHHFNQMHQRNVINEDLFAHQDADEGNAAAYSPPPLPGSASFIVDTSPHAGAGATQADNQDLHVQRQVYQPIATPDVRGGTAAADWGVRPATARLVPETSARPGTPHIQQWVSHS